MPHVPNGPQRVLIFWGGEGYGHLVAAKAIEARIRATSPQTEVILKDVMDFCSRASRFFITRSYDYMTKFAPRLYDAMFESYMRKAEKTPSIGDLWMVKSYRPDRMLQYLREVQPTKILVTFSPAAESLVCLRDHGDVIDVPVGHVMIDYVAEKYFSRLGERLEMTFVPHPSIGEDFIRWGLGPSKVSMSGVPFFPEAIAPLSEADALAFQKANDLDPRVPVVLLVSGAAGVGNFPLWVRTIRESASGPLQVVAVCGRNRRHVRALEKLRSSMPEGMTLKVFGLLPTEEALRHVKIADVVVTKTGALASTEILNMGKLAVFLDINGGQERYNSELVRRNRLALVTRDQSSVGALVANLLRDRELRDDIQAAQLAYRAALRPDAIRDWALQRS